MQHNFAHRIMASMQVYAVTEDQFNEWEQGRKAQYLKDHPNSSFGKDKPGAQKTEKPSKSVTIDEHRYELGYPQRPTEKDLKEKSQVESVPLDAVRATQWRREWDKFGTEGDLFDGFGDHPVAVRLNNGKYLLFDGHHRTDRALSAGDADMQMYVIDADDYAPELNEKYARMDEKKAPKQRTQKDRDEEDDLMRELGFAGRITASLGDISEAFRKGVEAGKRGDSVKANPYDTDTMSSHDWLEGHKMGLTYYSE